MEKCVFFYSTRRENRNDERIGFSAAKRFHGPFFFFLLRWVVRQVWSTHQGGLVSLLGYYKFPHKRESSWRAMRTQWLVRIRFDSRQSIVWGKVFCCVTEWTEEEEQEAQQKERGTTGQQRWRDSRLFFFVSGFVVIHGIASFVCVDRRRRRWWWPSVIFPVYAFIAGIRAHHRGHSLQTRSLPPFMPHLPIGAKLRIHLHMKCRLVRPYFLAAKKKKKKNARIMIINKAPCNDKFQKEGR